MRVENESELITYSTTNPMYPLLLLRQKTIKNLWGAGMQQALEYAEILQIPFVFTSNGDSFVFHDKSAINGQIETELTLDEFLLW